MPDLEILLKIKSAYVQKIKQGYFFSNPVPQVPVLVDGEPTGEVEPEFTNKQWFKKCLINHVVRVSNRGLRKKAEIELTELTNESIE